MHVHFQDHFIGTKIKISIKIKLPAKTCKAKIWIYDVHTQLYKQQLIGLSHLTRNLYLNGIGIFFFLFILT